MIELMEQLTFWHWLGLALILLIIEVTAFNGYLLWIGISAGVVAALVYIFDIAWSAQLWIFAFSSIASSWLWHKHWVSRPVKTEAPLLNQRSAQLIGRNATVIEPLVHGQGRVKIDDSIWRAQGPDADEGSVLRVVEVIDELTLKVDQLN